MLKMIGKRIVAFLCAVSIVTTSVGIIFPAEAATPIETLNSGLEQFTFSDFPTDISGTYKMNGSGWVLLQEYFSNGTTAGAFAGKVLNGYVTFGSDPFNFRLGNYTSMWVNDKFAFYRDANTPADALNFGFNGTTYTLTSEKAQTDLVDTPFNLKISFEEIDTNGDSTKDRLQLGLWFNDVLYDNQYFTVDGDYSAFVHGCVYIYGLGQGNGYVTLDTSASLNTGLEQFTFSDFAEDINGTYRMNGSGWVLLKEYFGNSGTAGAFAGKVLNGYVTFGSDPFNFRLGNYTSMWVNDKFAFYRDENTPADSLNFGFNGTTYTLTSEKAQTDLVDTPFNLKISFEEIDTNGDSTKDCLQLGLWFNDVLYDNQYFTVDGDYSAFVHGCVYIYGLGAGDGYVTLASNIGEEKEKEGTSITETNTGDMNRVPYNNDDITADLGVGAASYVAVVDKNSDGYMDLMVGSNCVPYGGTHIFYGSAESQNNTSGDYLLMDKGRQIAEYGNTFYASYLYKSNGSYDKTMLIGARDPETNSNSWAVLDAADYPDTFTRLTGRPGVGIPQEIFDMGFTDAFNPWTMAMADYDGDGDLDWITGWGNWEEYSSLGTNVSGDKFDNNGVWGDDNGDGIGDDDGDGDDDPVHSWVMWNENLDPNQGANGVGAAVYDTENTKGNLVYVYDYEMIGGVKRIVANTQKPLDVYGCGCPQLRDWDGDGDLDIVCASFVGELVYFENIGTATEPLYINGRSLVLADGSDAELELAMPVITAFDWNNDGYMDLICGEEDGRVCLVEHSGIIDSNGTPVMKDLQFFQTPADSVKDGVLNTPYSVDWDGDGDEDIISGNSAGFISLIENLTIKDGQLQGDLADPIWAKPVRFTNPDGDVYRFMAGYNGSIQGPAEAKWGYTQVSVADWDGDGILDVMSSNISGKVFVHHGIEGEKHQLENPIPVEVEWENGNKYPTWNWWKPNGNELVTQWRVTPYMIDLPLDEDGDGVAKGDGLIDLVMMDHEGYLTFFQRYKDKDGNLKLKEGQRIFKLSDGTTALNFNSNAEGKSGKVAYALVDFDQDGDIDILRSSDVNIGYYENISFKAGEYKFSAIPVHVHDRMLADHTPSPAICDWNGDDVPDLLVGTMDGHLYYMVNNIAEEPYVEPENPEKLDSTLEQLTFDDFNIANGKYDHVPGKDFVAAGDYNGAAKGSLANKVLNGNITFSEYAWLYIGGDDGLWSGFSIRGNGGDLILTFGGQEHTIKAKIAKTQLVGKEFNLKLSLQVEGGKLKLGVWINDTLYKNEYFETENYEKYLHGRMGIYPPWEGTYIEIESVTEAFVGHKEKLNSSLEQLTFDDFNISNGKYKHDPKKDFVATGEYNGAAKGSLANKVINGNITFSEHSWLYVGGDDGLWSGLSLRGSGDNLILTFGGKEYPIKSAVVGEKLVGNKFNLKLSYEVEDGKLKLGVWINDKLYKDEYFEAENYEKYLYGRMGIYPPWEGTYIEIESVTEPYVEPENPEVLESTLQQITFDDFNIANGRYDHVPGKDFVAVGDYNGAKAGSLSNKVINGNITFSEHAWLYVGGDIGYWYGFSLRGSGNNLILSYGGQEHIIKSEIAKTQLVGKEINLKLSFQEEGDKLKLGVWINDKLYKNQYFETENYEKYLHGRMGIYPPWEGTYIEIESVTEVFVGHKEVLNPKLKQITFLDFGIKDGTYYHSGDFTAWGEYNSGKAGSLANTVVCGDVTFSKSASWLYIGGDDGLWSGLSLRSSGDNLILSFGGKEYPIKSGVAGLKLVENKFNLKMSYEVEDDQLKLGVWINDKLYMDSYFYLKEYKWGEGTKTYENYLHGRLGIFPHWSKEEGNSWMTIASWEKPAKIYGSVTGSPFVGDTHNGMLYVGMILVASATLLGIGVNTTKKKRQ